MADESIKLVIPNRGPRVPMLTSRLLYLLGCNYAVNNVLGYQCNEVFPHELAFIAAPQNADSSDFSEYIYNEADGWWMVHEWITRSGSLCSTANPIALTEMIERIDFASRMNGTNTHNDAFRLGFLVGDLIGKLMQIKNCEEPTDDLAIATESLNNILNGMSNLGSALLDKDNVVLFSESHHAMMRGAGKYFDSAADGSFAALENGHVPLRESFDRYVISSIMIAGSICTALINEISDFDFGPQVTSRVDTAAYLTPQQQSIFLNVINGETKEERTRGLMCHSQILADLQRLKMALKMRVVLSKHIKEEMAIITMFRDGLVPLSNSNGHRSKFCGAFMKTWSNVRHPLVHGGVVTSTMIGDYIRAGVTLCGIANIVEQSGFAELQISEVISHHYPCTK